MILLRNTHCRQGQIAPQGSNAAEKRGDEVSDKKIQRERLQAEEQELQGKRKKAEPVTETKQKELEKQER